MADYTTEMDCIRTFLMKVHTPATTKHIGETSSIARVAATQRMFVMPGELKCSGQIISDLPKKWCMGR